MTMAHYILLNQPTACENISFTRNENFIVVEIEHKSFKAAQYYLF